MVDKLYKYLKKNQFYMLLYFATNLILLFVLDHNFTLIKVTLGKLLNIENIDYGLRIPVLVIIAIFLISIIPFRIVNKSINKSILFLFCIFSFQILSITLDNKNSYIINNNITIWVLLLFISLFFINLESAEKESCFCKKIYILLVETTCILFILYFLIGNQKDILDIVTNIINKEKKINSLKFIYYIFKLMFISMLLIIFLLKIFSSKENYDLKKIEKKMHNKNISFNSDRIKLIEENKGNFIYGDEDIRNEFIYNVKKKYSQDYSIIYKNRLYYLCDWYLNFKIWIAVLWRNRILKKKSMVIIDNIEKNEINKFEKIRKDAKLVTLNINNELFPSRIKSIEKLEKEIELGKDSILVDNIWGNGKTFFIKKFIEKYEKKYEFIYIKVPYFDTKTEFRKKILSEIHRIFKKNKIITSSLKDLMSYFNINDEGIKLGFINFNFNKLLSGNPEDDYREVLISIKDNLNYLEKKVVIILDDFDRIENKGQILEVLNFIGELNIELNESIALITLSSYEKLSDIVGENVNKKERKKCIDKYFDKIFYLPNSNLFELIDFFSDIYNLNLEKIKILKEIVTTINSSDNTLLIDNNITFRNIERLIKNIKEIDIKDIKQEFKDIYEKVFVFWEIVEYLISESWDEFKVIGDIDINEKTLVTPYSLYNIMLDKLKWSLKWNEIINFEKREIFIHSILEAVRKYKLSKYEEPLSHYLNIRDEMLNLNSNHKLNISYKDYKEINNMFNFTIENRKVIFNFLMKDKNITQCELLNLMIEYRINYKWNYEYCEDFFEELERNRNEGEKISRSDVCIFIKHLLLLNSFIDMQKIESLKDLEKKPLISLEKIYNFFKDFVIETKKNECHLSIDKIFNIAIDAKFYRGDNTSFDKKKNHMEYLKKELVDAQYLINEDDESIKSIKAKIQTVKNEFDISDLDEIINFLRENHNELYEIWENYFQEIRK